MLTRERIPMQLVVGLVHIVGLLQLRMGLEVRNVNLLTEGNKISILVHKILGIILELVGGIKVMEVARIVGALGEQLG